MRKRAASRGRARLGVIIVALVAAAGILTAGFLFLSSLQSAAYNDALLQRDTVTLAPGVHLLGKSRPSVAYVVETSAGLVLIDAGIHADASLIIEQLQELGLDPAQLRAILLTHVHGDHTLGARHLRETTGAKIYAGRGDSAPLRDGGPREAFFSTFKMEEHHVHSTPVDIELEGDQQLVFGDTRINAVATPGHTPGSVCYLLERDGLRVLFGGDTISSLIGDLGTYAAYLAPRYRGNARDYLQSLQKLRAMPAPDLVLPGHPNEQGRPHTPRLAAADWSQLLDGGIRDMRQLVARYEADGEDFLDGRPKTLLTGFFYLGEYQSRSLLALQAEQRLYLFDAPGDDGLAEFLEQRLKEAGVQPPAPSAVLLTAADSVALGGLESVVSKWNCQVYAAPAAHQSVRAACPAAEEILTLGDLPSHAELAIEPITLDGCGLGAVAYLFRRENRTVLVSGVAPSTTDEISSAQLRQMLFGPRGHPGLYIESLSNLRHVRPDVWTPAYPLNGQNANLYDDQWEQILLENLRLAGG